MRVLDQPIEPARAVRAEQGVVDVDEMSGAMVHPVARGQVVPDTAIAPGDGGAPEGAIVRTLGRTDYEATWRAMQAFTASRTASTHDEIWLTEHSPVYTVGLAARREHFPAGGSAIPLVRTDRGGQITYHGPGQIVAYALVDIRRNGWGVRAFVRKLESAIIELLRQNGVEAYGKVDAPGVYVRHPRLAGIEAKIGALGLKVKNGCTYHGVALNVDMDLTPFDAINPCGYPGLEVTQLCDLGVFDPAEAITEKLLHRLAEKI